MSRRIQLHTFQIGTPVRPGEGLRIAVTRRPPRGVPRADWKRVGCFDVWFPALAPSPELVAQLLKDQDEPTRNKLFAKYEKELLANAESRQSLELLVEIAARMPVSIGCFCANESRCHRARLYQVLMRLAGQDEERKPAHRRAD